MIKPSCNYCGTQVSFSGSAAEYNIKCWPQIIGSLKKMTKSTFRPQIYFKCLYPQKNASRLGSTYRDTTMSILCLVDTIHLHLLSNKPLQTNQYGFVNSDSSLCPSCSSPLLLKHILMECDVSTLYCSVDCYERIFNEVRPDLVLEF